MSEGVGLGFACQRHFAPSAGFGVDRGTLCRNLRFFFFLEDAVFVLVMADLVVHLRVDRIRVVRARGWMRSGTWGFERKNARRVDIRGSDRRGFRYRPDAVGRIGVYGL